MEGRRVLVVDDDPGILRLVTQILQRAGYAVFTAMDAAQAVMQAQQKEPDLILLDILMPAGGGLSVLDRLKVSTKTNIIPVIVVTGSQDSEMEAATLASGVLRILRKPFHTATLLDAVKEAIGPAE